MNNKNHNLINKIAIVIGTNTYETLMQIHHMLLNGLKIHNISDETGETDIYYFGTNNWRNINSKDFINKLKKYDLIIISGGETAFSLLNSSEFKFIKNMQCFMPLVSCGIINGGDLDSKYVILKGGGIGGPDIYFKIIDYFKKLYN
ncbi:MULTISPECIES: hypothetical protein [Acidiplasma]|jgi:uncharacterized protein YgbK (DUF1537 family)|uniref:hypothetical protein n=1 Tax=Acidiplasma TaxID=507753 RepID=UPI0005E379C8|nr:MULTISPECIES: hypothetical protein [unclassified Acidiplasma]KJE48682.1 hypothetical protein TZ01_08610 [Acidiplasma sp. MBA-1]WMT55453.1 MAG: hypothetical protein RE470_02130 [Acidiplasma sp.]